jgi:hypothetical protein
MGRGRQKAKQTKVARKLKYYTPDTDYRALERELSSANKDANADEESFGYYPAEDVDDWSRHR